VRISRYDHAQRQAAVARAFGGDSTAARVARELGVHPATLYRWANESSAANSGAASPTTHMRLVKAAQTLLRDHDYADITVEDVAACAGVSPRSTFHHFGGKRELFGAAIDHAASALVEEMTQRAERTPWPEEPLTRLRLILRIAAEAVHATPDAHLLFRELGVPPVDNFAGCWHERFARTLAQPLKDAADTGALDPDIDPVAAAKVIASAMRGIHAAVFEGAEPAQALLLVNRLHLLVTSR
jgi:AcrR family transcriptional regulator